MFVNEKRNDHSAAAAGSQPQLPSVVAKLNLLLHASVALVSLSIAFVLFDKSLFSWHPLFMSLGYLLFMTEGLISAVMFRHLDGPERVKAIWGHALMQTRALVCICIGFGVIYQNKVRPAAQIHAVHGCMDAWAMIPRARMHACRSSTTRHTSTPRTPSAAWRP